MAALISFESRQGTSDRWTRWGTLTKDPQGHLAASNGRVGEMVVSKRNQGLDEDQVWDYFAAGSWDNGYNRARLAA